MLPWGADGELAASKLPNCMQTLKLRALQQTAAAAAEGSSGCAVRQLLVAARGAHSHQAGPSPGGGRAASKRPRKSLRGSLRLKTGRMMQDAIASMHAAECHAAYAAAGLGVNQL